MVPNDDGAPPEHRRAVFQMDRREAESMTQAVVRALASVEDVPITEVESLHSHVDTEALNRLYDGTTHLRPAMETEFTVKRYRGIIRRGSSVFIYDRGDDG